MTTETANPRPQLKRKRTSFIVFAFGDASTTEASASSTFKEEIELNLVPTGEETISARVSSARGQVLVAEVFMMNG
jgi:hypothetical protein